MAENATLALPKDLIEPIIQAHIQSALAEAFNKEAIISKMAWQILNQKVDSNGKPAEREYNVAGTFLEVSVNKMLREAFTAMLAEEMEKHKETLKKYLATELKKDKSPLTKALVEGMCNGVVTQGLRYNLTVKVGD